MTFASPVVPERPRPTPRALPGGDTCQKTPKGEALLESRILPPSTSLSQVRPLNPSLALLRSLERVVRRSRFAPALALALPLAATPCPTLAPGLAAGVVAVLLVPATARAQGRTQARTPAAASKASSPAGARAGARAGKQPLVTPSSAGSGSAPAAAPAAPAAPAAATPDADVQGRQVLDDLGACAAIADAPQRLACYDRTLGRPIDTWTRPEAAPGAGDGGTAAGSAPASTPGASSRTPPLANPPAHVDRLPLLLSDPERNPEREADTEFSREALAQRRSLGSNLSDRWELDPAYDRGRFTLTGYKPVYLLFADWTSRRNLLPSSPNPNNVVGTPLQQRSTEAAFQISLKTKIAQGLIAGHGDLWLGYTQLSHWQIYNSGASRPFRETNYEPEMMATFRTRYSLFGWEGRMVGLALNHQSNGRDEPQSRSWNRIIGMFGFERGNWTVIARPWWRIPESASDDDNPDIPDYAGRMDLLLIHQQEGHEFSLLVRHSLRDGGRSHGAIQLGYAMPISSYLKGYVQLFSGYGASLLDYNHRQTRIGIGISMLQWL